MKSRVKACKKNLSGRCTFCPETALTALDAHRVVQGCEGGKYVWGNILICCASCHRKIHGGLIVVKGRHPTSGGRVAVIVEENGVEAVYYEPVFGV